MKELKELINLKKSKLWEKYGKKSKNLFELPSNVKGEEKTIHNFINADDDLYEFRGHYQVFNGQVQDDCIWLNYLGKTSEIIDEHLSFMVVDINEIRQLV